MKAISITTVAFVAATALHAQRPSDPPAFAPDLPGLAEPAEDVGASESRTQRAAGFNRETAAKAAQISGTALPRDKREAFAIRRTDQVIASEGALAKQLLEVASWPRFPRTQLPGREDKGPLAER